MTYKKENLNKPAKVPTILDIGCGYGGLMFELTKGFPDELIFGLEIRDKVVNFVGEKVRTLRINSEYKDCLNVGVLRANAMKTLHNYFEKDSVRIGYSFTYTATFMLDQQNVLLLC